MYKASSDLGAGWEAERWLNQITEASGTQQDAPWTANV